MYTKIKQEIKDIIEIVNQCPTELQEKCFELLLNNLLQEISSKADKKVPKQKQIQEDENVNNSNSEKTHQNNNNVNDYDDIQITDFHIKVRKLLGEKVTMEKINELYYKENDSILPLYEEMATNQASQSQVRLALLTAFENAISSGEFEFNVDEIRKRCQDMKCYDRANFGANFKKSKHLFEDDSEFKKGKKIKLSTSGKKEIIDVLEAIN